MRVRLLLEAARPVRRVDRRLGRLARPHGHRRLRVGGRGRPRRREPHGARHSAGGCGGGVVVVAAAVSGAASGGGRLQGTLKARTRFIV